MKGLEKAAKRRKNAKRCCRAGGLGIVEREIARKMESPRDLPSPMGTPLATPATWQI